MPVLRALRHQAGVNSRRGKATNGGIPSEGIHGERPKARISFVRAFTY
jgi:hypothetical protein